MDSYCLLFIILLTFLSLYSGLAQAILVSPLSKASQDARSPFLKMEAFRLLSLLFAKKPNAESSEIEKKAAVCIQEVQEELLTSFSLSLGDEEMKKTKRVRVLLKALDKFLHCLTSCSADCLKKLDSLQALVNDLGDSDSNAVKAACTKLAGEIDTKMAELKVDTETNTLGSSVGPSSSSKKKKKKKKKR
jgi:hypothetical protein